MQKINQPNRSRDHRQAAIRHVWYEWSTLLQACTILAKYNAPEMRRLLDKGVYSLALEGFVIHFRNLYEFLFEPDQDGKRVCAVDYGVTIDGLHVLRSPVLKTWFGDASFQIVHIGYRRTWVDPAKINWPFVEITTALLAPFRYFLANGDFDGKPELLKQFDLVAAQLRFFETQNVTALPVESSSKLPITDSIVAATTAHPTVASTPVLHGNHLWRFQARTS
jgi:hypothetical protein